MISFQKPPIIPTILTILGIAVLCSLGTWQLQRLEWKQDLLEKIESRDETTFLTLRASDMTPENEFFKGEIKGTFLFNNEIKLQARTFDGTPGVHVITPLQLNDNKTLLVNRGWAPLDYEGAAKATKPVHVTGMVRKITKPNIFVPPNAPAQSNWYSINLEEIAEAKTLKNILPVMLYEIDLTEGSHGIHYPDPNALEIHLNNNHRQYAFFWFLLAGILLVIYALRFLRKQA